ncbi:MAG: hypothetical protein QXJ58_05080 [Archaeoglobaceae archaeon]
MERTGRPKLCPLTNKACVDCPIYRGRHYKMDTGFCQESAHIDDPRTFIKLFEEVLGLATGEPEEVEDIRARLILVDAETGKQRTFNLDEVTAWDWKNPEKMRLIDGFHVRDHKHLIRIIKQKMESGKSEITIVEYPRFMLLAGG